MEKKSNIEKIVQKTLYPLGFEGQIDIRAEGESVSVNIQTPDAGVLIGRGGENLRALQHLVLLMVSKELGCLFGPGEFSLDVNNYKKDRENFLVSLAKNAAYEVRETKHERELEPMPASERRVVHVTLALFDGVFTESTGDRRDRRVVVKPTI